MRGPQKNFGLHALTAVLASVFAVVVLGVLLSGTEAMPNIKSDYHIRAIVPNTASLSPQSRVTMAGVNVGSVTSVTRQGKGAVLRLRIDDDHAPLASDTRVKVRLRTLVGEKYVELINGHEKSKLEEDAVLPMSQADDFVDVDTVLSQLRGRTRTRARQLFQGLGGSVGTRGPQLNQVLENTAGAINVGTPPVQTLARQHGQITSLVSNFGELARDIGDRGDALAGLARQLRGTALAVQSRDGKVRELLNELPPTLAQARETSGILRATSLKSAPVLTRLAGAVTDLKPTVQRLEPAAQSGRRLVAELGPAAPRLKYTLDDLQKLSGPLTKTLPVLNRNLCQLNPLLRRVTPYEKDLVALINGLGAATNAYDANGHIARLYLGVGSNSLIGAQSPGVAAATKDVLGSGLLSDTQLLGYNPYPPPGDNSNTTIGANDVGPLQNSIPYDRIQADC